MSSFAAEFIFPSYVDRAHGNYWEYQLAKPVAGAAATFKVPGDYWFVVLASTVTLVTSATVASRVVQLQALDSTGTVVFRVGSVAPEAASATTVYEAALSVGTSYQSNTAPNRVMMPSVPFPLPSGYQLSWTADSLQVGDQFSAFMLQVNRYPTGYVTPSTPPTPAPLPIEALELPALV